MNKSFALAVTIAATAFLATGCGDNSNCQNGKLPDGTVCNQRSGGSSGGSGSLFRSSGENGEKGSGGFGESHGGGGDAGG